MKNLIVLFVSIFSLIFNLSVNAQDVEYGNVQYDGFYNIKKGAFWSSRPEAKKVFNGETPAGVKVYILTQDNFVRFTPKNHTDKTRNYIVFPVGAKIYQKNGEYFAAKCGNKIIYIKPVTQVVIKKEIVRVPVRVEVPVKVPSACEPCQRVVDNTPAQKADCSEAQFAVMKLEDDYYVKGIIKKYKLFLYHLNRLKKNPRYAGCIDPTYEPPRANKGLSWLKDNIVDLANLAVNVDSNIRLRNQKTNQVVVYKDRNKEVKGPGRIPVDTPVTPGQNYPKTNPKKNPGKGPGRIPTGTGSSWAQSMGITIQ